MKSEKIMGFTIFKRAKPYFPILFFLFFGSVLCAHTPRNFDLYIDEVVDNFAKEMEHELGLHCIATGGRMSEDIDTVSVRFRSYDAGTVEQARELIVKAIERLVNMINANEKIRPFLREYPFPYYRAGISISFPRRPSVKDSVDYVIQAKKQLFYDHHDPEVDPRITLHEEPYTEALKIVLHSPRS